MQLTADTLSTPDRGIDSHVRSQRIHFVNKRLGIERYLNLQQHHVPDPDLNGLTTVDGPAYGWGCAQAPSGKSFLVLLFSCTNHGSAYCNPDWHRGSSEWDTIYEDRGLPLFPENRDYHEEDVRVLKRLGIYEKAFLQVDPVGEVFWQ